MSQDNLVKLKCKESGLILYWTCKNKKSPNKLLVKKYNSKLRKHTIFEETKK